MAGRSTLIPHANEREASMNPKEHLQFLIMMAPTLLLLVAVLVSLAWPSRAESQQAQIVLEEVAVLDTEIGPVPTVAVR